MPMLVMNWFLCAPRLKAACRFLILRVSYSKPPRAYVRFPSMASIAPRSTKRVRALLLKRLKRAVRGWRS